MSLTTTISPATVEGISERYNEPAWLADERRAALRSFETLSFPTNRDEAWRYTDLKRFALDGLGLVTAPTDRTVP